MPDNIKNNNKFRPKINKGKNNGLIINKKDGRINRKA